MKAHELTSMIDATYMERANATSLCPLRLSGLGACPRSLAFQLEGMDKNIPDARAQRIFEMGHSRGASIAAAFRDSRSLKSRLVVESELWMPLEGVVFPTEVVERCKRVFGEQDLPVAVGADNLLYIRGRSDILLEDNDGVDIIEVKTKNSYGFDRLDDEGPGHDYMCQLSGYIRALSRSGLKVRSATFLFENKDNCEHKAIEFNYEAFEPTFNAVLDTLADVVNVFAKRGDPRRAPAMYAANVKSGKLPWNCNYCAIGPERASCVTAGTLVDKRKSGAAKPAWTVC